MLVTLTIPVGCTFNSSQPFTDSNGEKNIVRNLTDIVPFINTTSQVSIEAGNTSYQFFGGRVYAKATPEQANLIISLLTSIDISNFEETEDPMIGWAGGSIMVEDNDMKCSIYVTRNQDSFYLRVILDDGTEQILKGPPDAFYIPDLTDATTQVLADTSDTENLGKAYVLDKPHIERVIIKANTAIAQNILDGSADWYGVYDGPDEYKFDAKVVIGKSTYMIDSVTGIFSREQDRITNIFRVPEMWLDNLLFICGISSDLN